MLLNFRLFYKIQYTTTINALLLCDQEISKLEQFLKCHYIDKVLLKSVDIISNDELMGKIDANTLVSSWQRDSMTKIQLNFCLFKTCQLIRHNPRIFFSQLGYSTQSFI